MKSVSAYEFGIVGDGVADDTARLQAACDTISLRGGGALWLGDERATIRTTDSIVLGSNIELCGKATIKPDAAAWSGAYASPFFTNRDYDAASIATRNIAFRGLKLDGTGFTAGGAHHSIRFRMARGVKCVEVDFVNVDNGTAFLASADTLTDKCTARGVINCAYDHWDGTVGARVTDCLVDGSANQGILFTGCGTASEDRHGEDFVCTGNTVRNVKGGGGAAGIIVNANDAGSSVSRARVANNYVADSDVAYVMTGAGGAASFVGNIAERCINTAFYAGPDGGNFPNNISLVGHVAIDCQTWSEGVIRFGGGTGHSVVGAIVKGSLPYAYAISMDGADDWTIDGGNLKPGSAGRYKIGSATNYRIDGCEYGVWTPELRFGGSPAGIAYVRRSGIWTRQGRNVRVVAEFLLSDRGPGTGLVSIGGLPFPALQFGTGPQNQAAGMVQAYDGMVGLAGQGYPLGLIAAVSELYPYIYSSVTSGNLQHSHFSNTSRLRFEASYIVAA